MTSRAFRDGLKKRYIVQAANGFIVRQVCVCMRVHDDYGNRIGKASYKYGCSSQSNQCLTFKLCWNQAIVSRDGCRTVLWYNRWMNGFLC